MGSGGKLRLCHTGSFNAVVIEVVEKPEVLALYLTFLSDVAVVTVKQNKVKDINKHAFSSLICGTLALKRTCFACKQNLFKISVTFGGYSSVTQRPKLSN